MSYFPQLQLFPTEKALKHCARRDSNTGPLGSKAGALSYIRCWWDMGKRQFARGIKCGVLGHISAVLAQFRRRFPTAFGILKS